jgi:hypothetical protein
LEKWIAITEERRSGDTYLKEAIQSFFQSSLLLITAIVHAIRIDSDPFLGRIQTHLEALSSNLDVAEWTIPFCRIVLKFEKPFEIPDALCARLENFLFLIPVLKDKIYSKNATAKVNFVKVSYRNRILIFTM